MPFYRITPISPDPECTGGPGYYRSSLPRLQQARICCYNGNQLSRVHLCRIHFHYAVNLTRSCGSTEPLQDNGKHLTSYIPAQQFSRRAQKQIAARLKYSITQTKIISNFIYVDCKITRHCRCQKKNKYPQNDNFTGEGKKLS